MHCSPATRYLHPEADRSSQTRAYVTPRVDHTLSDAQPASELCCSFMHPTQHSTTLPSYHTMSSSRRKNTVVAGSCHSIRASPPLSIHSRASRPSRILLLVLLIHAAQALVTQVPRRPVYPVLLVLSHPLSDILEINRVLLPHQYGIVVVGVPPPHGQDALHRAVVLHPPMRPAGLDGRPSPAELATETGRVNLSGPWRVVRKLVARGLVAGLQAAEAALEEWPEQWD